MEESRPEKSQPEEERDRFVYLVPQGSVGDRKNPDISLLDLWDILWRGKWIVIGISFLFVAASIPYALSLTEWYRSDVLLAPADEKSTSVVPAQFGGLASLAGVRVDSGNANEYLAILKSREFTRDFIMEHDLLPVLFADQWDAATGQWIESDPNLRPDIQDAVRQFRNDIVSVDRGDTGLTTLVVEWTDREIAAKWANLLISRLNEHLRQRALVNALSNVDYLQSELAKTSVVTLQQSIGRLLETEMQKLMLARGNEEFAFRVIDPAEPPKLRSRPNRTLIVLVAGLLGGMLSVLIVFATHAVRTLRRKSSDCSA